MTPSFLRMREIFAPVVLVSFRILHPEYRHVIRNFRFHTRRLNASNRDNASGFAKRLIILIQMIQKVFGGDTMAKAQNKESYIRFNNGHTSGESFVCPGRPFASRNKEHIETIRRIIMENRCVTIEEIAYEMGICIGS